MLEPHVLNRSGRDVHNSANYLARGLDERQTETSDHAEKCVNFCLNIPNNTLWAKILSSNLK